MAGRPGASESLLSQLLLLLLLVTAADGCWETVLQRGTLDNSQLVVPPVSTTSSCACCAECNHHADCASISYDPDSGACRLYLTVPDFTTLQVDGTSVVYVMPGRSQHLQFCREDSDCLEPDDACYGRICTTDRTVTCRDLAELGAPAVGVFYGSADGQLMKYKCTSDGGITGWTQIGAFPVMSDGWTTATVLERNTMEPDGPYSILQIADQVLRPSGTEPRFGILVVGKNSNDDRFGFRGSVPRAQSLASTTDTAGADLVIEEVYGGYDQTHYQGSLRVPWLQPSGAALLTMTDYHASWYHDTLINTYKKPYIGEHLQMARYFIRE